MSGKLTLTRRQFALGLAATPAAAFLASCGVPGSSSSSGPVLYGVSGPFSGNNAEYGRIWKKAMAMALDEINAAGGVKGRKVDLDYQDTQADAKQSVPVAQKFVDNKNILAELGDFASPASMAASPIYQRAKLVQFGFTNSHPDFTKGGEYMFSIVLTQEQDASFLAQTAFDKLGKKQAVLYRNTDWGKTTSDIYIKKIKDLGGQIVASENYLETENDFRAILTKVRDAKPDVLALIAYYNDGALLAQQAKQVGLDNVKIVANGACYSPQFLKLGGDAVNDVLMTTVFFPGNPRPDVQKFVTAYKQKNNEDPDQFAALAYDAVKILAWATEKGGFDRQAIQKAMATGTDLPSVIYGPFKFGADRRVENAKAVPIAVKNGQFVAVS
ncbi:MAG: ABC transporter substrate-binding protein [Thermomicrobiales bacterium]|jgi:branched-chain amino acid transport system substrate-binding protein